MQKYQTGQKHQAPDISNSSKTNLNPAPQTFGQVAVEAKGPSVDHPHGIERPSDPEAFSLWCSRSTRERLQDEAEVRFGIQGFVIGFGARALDESGYKTRLR